MNLPYMCALIMCLSIFLFETYLIFKSLLYKHCVLKTLPSTDLLLRIPVVYYISVNIGIPYFLLLISILIQLFFDYF